MDTRLDTPYLALRYGIGLTATLAGADKFFNLLTDWGMYLSPTAAAMLPVSPSAARTSRPVLKARPAASL